VRRLIDAVLYRQAQWAARNNAIWCDAMARDLVALADDDGGVRASHLAAAMQSRTAGAGQSHITVAKKD
jgi:hypothetical protein